VLSYEAACAAPPERVWELVASPDRWSSWAPHVRGAWGLGSPQVEQGARGAVRVLGVVPVPAQITAKRAGRAWSWRVGGVMIDHRVEPRPRGCVVAFDVRAAAPLEALLRVTYGPLLALLARNLARVAERAG
jgi:hypothetical protein